MKVLVLGASGGCGRWAVRIACERGHDVKALVRPETPFEAPDGARVLRGDPLDGAVLDEALDGQDAVACCLGIRRRGLSPWSRLTSPPDLTERASRALVEAMRRRGVPRVAAISAGGVAESFARVSWPMRLLIRWSNLGIAYQDLAVMERVLAQSGLDWLAVRPVTLVGGALTGRARPVERYGLLSRIRRADVAAFLIDALEQPERTGACMLGR